MDFYLQQLQLGGTAAIFGSSILLSLTIYVTYNLFFHPLRNFPGDLIDRSSLLGYGYRVVRGTSHKDVLSLHNKYGPVVRIAPNELSFIEPGAWKDIYGHRTGPNHQAAPEMPKHSKWYDANSTGHNIVIEPSRERHGQLRRQLAHGFSDRSLRGQESIIGGYVDLLIRRLRERAPESSHANALTGEKKVLVHRPQDMTKWYNWATFDVVGDLSFGEPFGCLEKAEYDPWVAAIFNAVKIGTIFRLLRYFRMTFLTELLKRTFKSRRQLADNSKAKMLRRMQLDHERPDFMEGLLKSTEKLGIDMDELQGNAGVIIIAGSETTATLLDGATYLLLKHTDKLQKLTEEVRSAFRREEEITLLSVSRLNYMLACLDEALRRYPPISIALPRVVPEGGWTIAGTPVPQGTAVGIWQWAANHSTVNFKDPFEYRPERWLHDPEFVNDKMEARQPFSVGQRNCLGRNLAYAEMRLILVRIIFNFDMQLANEKDDWLDQQSYTLWQKKPLNVHLTPVPRSSSHH